MANRGETVKYVIDADTSGFARGMAEAALESDLAGRAINRNLTRTAKGSENNFKDIRRNAQTAASSIRNFGVALQGFNLTSIIIGVSALSGAILELSGAIAAAGSTVSILFPALLQAGAAITTFKTGVSGLGAAFKAIGKNDGTAFAKSLQNLGPAATKVAYAAAGINKAFNGVRLNVQQKLFDGLAKTILELGANILPTLNAGMQEVARSMNGALKQVAALGETPLFKGLLSTIFADTANNISILSGALGPILAIFTNLYLITRPYVTLLAQQFVNLTKNLAAYLGSVRGQVALNIAIQEGLIALKELGGLVSAVFGFLTAIFRTSVSSGVNLITTLTGIVRNMQNWVNSAAGQAKLVALFQFTSTALQAVATAIGHALNFFFTMVQVINNLNPVLRGMIFNFLATSITLRPLLSYLSQLYLAIRVLVGTVFNFAEQVGVMFVALGAVSSVALILATAFIILGAIIKGPLGGALLIVGAALAAYIFLNYLLGGSSVYAGNAFIYQATAAYQAAASGAELSSLNILTANTLLYMGGAAIASGEGLGFAARGALFLQEALIPLLVLAAGVLIILSMLGVFSSKAKQASGASIGLGGSLGALQKSMKGVGSTGNKLGNGGLNKLNTGLNNVGDSAAAATGSLAAFDKMNVLTDNNANAGGPGSGIPGVPSLPDVGGAGVAAPTLDTGAFDKALSDMQKNFGNLQGMLGKPLNNPFDALGKWIDKHVVPSMIIFGAILAIVVALFAVFGFTAIVAATTVGIAIGLIVIAIVAIIAIAILLWKNWDAVWLGIKLGASAVWQFLQAVWDGILGGAMVVVNAIGGIFTGLWNGVKGIFAPAIAFFTTIFQGAWNAIAFAWSVAVAFFSTIFTNIQVAVTIFTTLIVALFKLAWTGIVAVWNVAVGFFSGLWGGIQGVFASVAGFFGSVFAGAWNAIKNAFGAVGGFFKGVWNTIVGIFGAIGTAVGDAIGGAFKSVINGVIAAAQNILNAPINTINSLIKKVNSVPGVPNLPTLSTFTLPRLAKGGVINSPMVAQLGEAGAEAVMPLENNTGWIDMLADKINSSNGSKNGQPINLTVKIGEDKVANKIIDLINEKTQMGGRNTILV